MPAGQIPQQGRLPQGKQHALSHPEQPDLFFDDLAREAYRHWQKREEAKDAAKTSAHNRLVIENGDPEIEAAVQALEQGWIDGRE